MFKPVFHRTSAYLTGLVVLLLMVGTIPALVASEEIQWRETLEDTMKEAEKTGKPVMIDFYTDW
jgi:thiol:disulfide interchange protein